MKRINENALTFLLFAAIGTLCAFSRSAKAGASEGIRLCEEVIIPSLLPILIISTLIINSKAETALEKLFGTVFEKMLRLPRASAGAIILGMICGYPSGAVLTCRLYEKGLIEENEAERIMHFNLCGGFAFIITAVGTVVYGNTKTGVILLLINILSAVIIMLFDSVGKKKPLELKSSRNYAHITEALPEAVETSVKAILTMSAYIILFSAFSSIISIPSFLMPIIEITNGVCNNELPLEYCAFFLSFGGLCVHLQLFGFLKKMKIKYVKFLVYRIVAGLLSFGIAKLYIAAFPQSEEVFSNISSPIHEFSSGGIALSMIMIIGCAVVVLDIENRKLKLI